MMMVIIIIIAVAAGGKKELPILPLFPLFAEGRISLSDVLGQWRKKKKKMMMETGKRCDCLPFRSTVQYLKGGNHPHRAII